MQQFTNLHVVQCAASVVDPPARVNKCLYWRFLGPGYMREIPDVLCHEGVSAGLNGSEVCLFVIFPHGDRCCFPPRGHFFLGAWWSGVVGLFVVQGTAPYRVTSVSCFGRWFVLWRVVSSSSVASQRRYARLQRKEPPCRVTCVF